MLEFQFYHVNKQWTKFSSSGNEEIKESIWNWKDWINMKLNIKVKISKKILLCKLIFVYSLHPCVSVVS